MKKSRFTEEQIITTLKRVEAGAKISDVCRDVGISQHTFYQWRSKFSGMEISDARRLRALEEENRKLKRIVADQALDLVVLKDLASKKW